MKPLLALSARCCRWPVGPDPGIGRCEALMFCAAPCAPADPYCAQHMRAAWPRRVVTPSEVWDRNLVTIKLALARRRPAMSRDEALDELHHNADLIGRQPLPSEIAEVIASTPEPAAEPMAPKGGIFPPSEAESPAAPAFEVGAQLAVHDNTETIHDSAASMDAKPGDTLRPVVALHVASRDLAPIPTEPPMLEWMAPQDLLVEGRYQRDLSDASRRLIDRIVSGWDWRKFKPPIVAWTERGFEIIDGQHTAIAAATHPLIDKIPVQIVEAARVEDRAAAFIGHNRDRIAVTPVQMHRANVAAGDPDALTVQQIADRAGATIVYSVWGQRKWKPGETIAVAAIKSLADRRGAMKARETLEVLVKAGVARIGANHLKAVDMLLTEPAFAELDRDDLPATIGELEDTVEREARLDAQTHQIPVWNAMGRIYFRKCRKKRRAA